MKKKYLLKNGLVINEGKREEKDLLTEDKRIIRIDRDISDAEAEVIDCSGKLILPGVIDDQVHFREPGLTHKSTIYSGARAAVAGGITTYMEMPNTKPPTLTQELLQEKYDIAAKNSLANYSFYMGASNENIEEVLKTDPEKVCGIKVFMGSSTGNMLVDEEETLKGIFSKTPMLVAVHAEEESVIRRNTEIFREKYGQNIPISFHPEIRSEEACYQSSSKAVRLAEEFGTRLHVLHISTAKEVGLFSGDKPLKDKKITAEACIHHLWFSREDYEKYGTHIKWNPAVKNESDREGIWKGLLEDKIDVIATDHAPHTVEEKDNDYWNAPSGGPLVQHSLVAMLEFCKNGQISLEKIVEKMCHNPAVLFRIKERGFLREGYFADIVVCDPERPWTVQKENILYKAGWSPFSGTTFNASVRHTFVSGHHAYSAGSFNEEEQGERITFYS